MIKQLKKIKDNQLKLTPEKRKKYFQSKKDKRNL